MNLKNKTILLTGATGGIGQCLTNQLAAQGANLILVGRKESVLNELYSALSTEIKKQHHSYVVADLTSSQGRKKILSASVDIDVLINLAGVNQLTMLTQMSDTDIAQMVESNLITPMQLCKDLVPLLQSKPEAAIVNVGSILGSIGMAGSAVYCASKFGLRGFTESLHRELADTSIKVLYIAPRATDTAMNNDKATALNKELGNRVDSPELVAHKIVDALTSEKNHSRYLGWPEKFFVRINALFPTMVDGSLRKQLTIIQRHTQP